MPGFVDQWSPFYFDVYDVIDLGEINYRKDEIYKIWNTY